MHGVPGAAARARRSVRRGAALIEVAPIPLPRRKAASVAKKPVLRDGLVALCSVGVTLSPWLLGGWDQRGFGGGFASGERLRWDARVACTPFGAYPFGAQAGAPEERLRRGGSSRETGRTLRAHLSAPYAVRGTSGAHPLRAAAHLSTPSAVLSTASGHCASLWDACGAHPGGMLRIPLGRTGCASTGRLRGPADRLQDGAWMEWFAPPRSGAHTPVAPAEKHTRGARRERASRAVGACVVGGAG
jgi:hypothetical protein